MNDLNVDANTETKVVNLINFHGLTLWVVEHEGEQYIPVKPLSDMAKVDWRGAKKAVFTPDNAILFGTKELNQPVFVAEEGDKCTQKTSIYIRLDRSRMYLARINTNRMRAHGNEEAATQLLNLQIEWAEALNKYELNGVAYKKACIETQKSLKDFYSILKSAPKSHQPVIESFIETKWDELGFPVPTAEDSQGQLEV